MEVNTKLYGSCLCGDVRYSVENSFNQLYACHCEQCKKITGSAFASNLFINKEYLSWLSGKAKMTVYKDAKRDFTKAFCETCGSGLPFMSGDGNQYIVPAGSLSGEPVINRVTRIFCNEISEWEKNLDLATKHNRFPEE